jgi:putative endonuclease
VIGPARGDGREIGQVAERFAADALRRVGYRIVEANVRYPVGEIDLVAEDGACLVFVEVRARRPGRYGGAAETLTAKKRRRVYLAVERYLQDHRVPASRPIRIDVVAIELDVAGRPIRHEVIANAFGES